MKQESLKYHQPVFDLIGQKPSFSATNLQLLRKLEQETGVKLPASVREWYSLENGVELLANYSNSDHATTVEDLGRRDKYWRDRKDHHYDFLLEQNLLIVLIETQSVWTWAVKIDGSDDPPVFTCAGSPEPESEWVLCAESFSSFVYTRIWDFDWDSDYYLCAVSNEKFHSNVLAFLSNHFMQGPQTFSYGCTNLRFYSGTKGIHLFVGDKQTQWNIRAANYQELLELTSLIWNQADLAKTLEAPDESIPANTVLRVLRNNLAETD